MKEETKKEMGFQKHDLISSVSDERNSQSESKDINPESN